MNQEIERKFTVDLKSFLANLPKYKSHRFDRIKQTYLMTENPEVRIRLVTPKNFADDTENGQCEAYLTVKSTNMLVSRVEKEVKIELNDAILVVNDNPKSTLTKDRYTVEDNHGQVWEVSHFLSGTKHGETLAEIELSSINQNVILPLWVTEEVTDDPEYYNRNMVEKGVAQVR